MNEMQNLNYAEIKTLFDETKKELREISQEKFDKQIAEYRRYRKEITGKIDKRFSEIAVEIDKLNRHLGGITKNNGDMAEEFFFNAFRKDKKFLGEKYDRIHKGYFSSIDPYRYEYDIVLFNGTNIAIIEVKYKARNENVDIVNLLSRVEHFKKYAKEYKNHNIILGVAAMSFISGLATKLHQYGIATIHPVGKKMVIYDKNVKVY